MNTEDKVLIGKKKNGFLDFLAEAVALEIKSTFKIVSAPFKSAYHGSADDIKNALREDEQNTRKLLERYCRPKK